MIDWRTAHLTEWMEDKELVTVFILKSMELKHIWDIGYPENVLKFEILIPHFHAEISI